MSIRIGQQTEPRNYEVADFAVKRGGVAATLDGEIFLVSSGRTTWVNGVLVASGTIPATGNWTIEITNLDTFDPQYFGRGGVGSVITDLLFSAGVISFVAQPTIAAGNTLTIQGALS